MEKILVIGHLGLLGRALMDRLGGCAVGVDRGECDAADPAAVEKIVEETAPQAIINCVGYTAVDQAESEPEAAMALNADAVEVIARAAARRGIHLISLSTDYVFTGEGSEPWPEDAPEEAFGPLSVYGKSKLEGERRLRRAMADSPWCLARTQWLYGAGGKNFVDRIAELATERPTLKVIDDQVGAPTWVRDLAGALAALVERRATGVYHLVNSGYCSWFEIARRVVEKLGLACEVTPCPTEEYPTPARRPKNSRLVQDKYIALTGAPMRPWTEALDEYLAPRMK